MYANKTILKDLSKLILLTALITDNCSAMNKELKIRNMGTITKPANDSALLHPCNRKQTWSPDKRFVVVKQPNIIVLHDSSGNQLTKIKNVEKFAFSANSEVLAVLIVDRTHLGFDMDAKRRLQLYNLKNKNFKEKKVFFCRFSQDGNFIAEKLQSKNNIYTLALLDMATGNKICSTQTKYSPLVKFSPLSSYLAVTSDNKTLYLYETETNQKTWEPTAIIHNTSHLYKFSPNENYLAYVCIYKKFASTLRIYDIRAKKTFTLKTHFKNNSLTFSPNSKFLITNEKIYNVQTLESIDIKEPTIESPIFSPDSKFFVTKHLLKGTLHLHNTATGDRIEKIPMGNLAQPWNRNKLPKTFLFSPSGKFLGIAYENNQSCVFNLHKTDDGKHIWSTPMNFNSNNSDNDFDFTFQEDRGKLKLLIKTRNQQAENTQMFTIEEKSFLGRQDSEERSRYLHNNIIKNKINIVTPSIIQFINMQLFATKVLLSESNFENYIKREYKPMKDEDVNIDTPISRAYKKRRPDYLDKEYEEENPRKKRKFD